MEISKFHRNFNFWMKYIDQQINTIWIIYTIVVNAKYMTGNCGHMSYILNEYTTENVSLHQTRLGYIIHLQLVIWIGTPDN